MAGYSRRVWNCPFFRWDEKLCIHCEGGCVRFPDRAAIRSYADRYCAHPKNWEHCSVAAELLDYYARKEE